MCRRPEGGRRAGSGTDRKKRRRQTEAEWGDHHEYLYSVQSIKEMRSKRKRKEEMEFKEGREARGSVFILAQVSLFLKVVILRRCETFLQIRRERASG